jgi:thiol-disulfide isomerase/thioredoxin
VKNRFMPSLLLSLTLGGLVFAPLVSYAQTPTPTTTATLGGPLAKELQGKPAVVDVYATWCPACQAIAPTLSNLRTKYKDKVNFVVLDVTDRAATQQAETNAKRMGLTAFLKENKASTGTVAIINPETGEILGQFRGNENKDDYIAAIDAVTAKIKK